MRFLENKSRDACFIKIISQLQNRFNFCHAQSPIDRFTFISPIIQKLFDTFKTKNRRHLRKPSKFLTNRALAQFRKMHNQKSNIPIELQSSKLIKTLLHKLSFTSGNNPLNPMIQNLLKYPNEVLFTILLTLE